MFMLTGGQLGGYKLHMTYSRFIIPAGALAVVGLMGMTPTVSAAVDVTKR